MDILFQGCILSLVESMFKVYRHICGFQLIPFILSTENESISESYVGYLLLAFFFGFTLFMIYGIFKNMSRIFWFSIFTPQFGPKSKENIECDLSHQVRFEPIYRLCSTGMFTLDWPDRLYNIVDVKWRHSVSRRRFASLDGGSLIVLAN